MEKIIMLRNFLIKNHQILNISEKNISEVDTIMQNLNLLLIKSYNKTLYTTNQLKEKNINFEKPMKNTFDFFSAFNYLAELKQEIDLKTIDSQTCFIHEYFFMDTLKTQLAEIIIKHLGKNYNRYVYITKKIGAMGNKVRSYIFDELPIKLETMEINNIKELNEFIKKMNKCLNKCLNKEQTYKLSVCDYTQIEIYICLKKIVAMLQPIVINHNDICDMHLNISHILDKFENQVVADIIADMDQVTDIVLLQHLLKKQIKLISKQNKQGFENNNYFVEKSKLFYRQNKQDYFIEINKHYNDNDNLRKFINDLSIILKNNK